MEQQPTVCAVMLTKDRPEFAARAVRCFREQTYERKRLLIWNNGETLTGTEVDGPALYEPDRQCITPRSIGELRNEANSFADTSDILIHFDDDDWSHPRRIEEQVAHLIASGADAVGYNQMLFWRTARLVDPAICDMTKEGGEAWLYSNGNPAYCLGTSLCYWRRTWKRKPFPDVSRGEDLLWQTGLKTRAVSSWIATTEPAYPRMIASIHGGNTASKIQPEAREWTRVPYWDDWCRETMKL